MVKVIYLNHDKIAVVDEEDFMRVAQFKWHAKKRGRCWYAESITGKRPYRIYLYLHRVIMNAKNGEEIDHINNNPLDNRKCNLRFCTRTENKWNSRMPLIPKSSQFKGVSWCKRTRKWRVSIRVKPQKIVIGEFDSELEAAKQYNKAAIKLHGKFAQLNTIEE